MLSLESITSLVNLSVCSRSLPVGRVSTTNSCRGDTTIDEIQNKVGGERFHASLPMTEAHLLDGVVLTNLGGNLLYNWAVLHLGEMLLLTDWAISTNGPCLQHIQIISTRSDGH